LGSSLWRLDREFGTQSLELTDEFFVGGAHNTLYLRTDLIDGHYIQMALGIVVILDRLAGSNI
jgi:hypothetical protein